VGDRAERKQDSRATLATAELVDTNVKVNLMSPGHVRTEMAPAGPLAPEVCHPTLDYLLDLPLDGPSGRFFCSNMKFR